jgi:hypothetical protein
MSPSARLAAAYAAFTLAKQAFELANYQLNFLVFNFQLVKNYMTQIRIIFPMVSNKKYHFVYKRIKVTFSHCSPSPSENA